MSIYIRHAEILVYDVIVSAASLNGFRTVFLLTFELLFLMFVFFFFIVVVVVLVVDVIVVVLIFFQSLNIFLYNEANLISFRKLFFFPVLISL